MKANEFIKKFGWSKAKEVSSFTSNVCEDPTHFDSDLDIYVHFNDFKGVMDESDVCIHDLKRLIESHEWVGLCGGLEDARALAVVHNDVALFESIADVESCMEVAQ